MRFRRLFLTHLIGLTYSATFHFQELNLQSDASFYIQSKIIDGLNYNTPCAFFEMSEAYTSYWLPALGLASVDSFYSDSDTCFLEVSDSQRKRRLKTLPMTNLMALKEKTEV